MKKIVLTGGGTAGHVMPNVALLPYIRKHFDEIHYIGSVGGMEEEIISKSAEDVLFHSISCVKLRRSFTPKNLAVPFRLLSSVRAARRLLSEIKPNVIFSKGGFVSLPVCLAAKGLAPVVLHESDFTMGLANKLSKGGCDKILTSFEGVVKNGIWTGTPLRRELYSADREKARNALGFTSTLPYLLVTGGSQGAAAINEAVISALPRLLTRFNVIHITGNGFTEKPSYPNYKSFPFSNDMPTLYAACDFVLCRGGANTLFELTALRKPALVIPLPTRASRGDQLDNARYFESLGATKTLLQESLTDETLLDGLTFLCKNAAVMRQNARMAKNIDGTERIANILSAYAE